jgi:hypothetical protein
MKSSDLSLRIANTIGLLRATQSPVGGADWVRRRICRLHAMGVLARRLGCYKETRGRPVQPSAGKHAPWPQFCESRPVQLAASHLVRAEATVGCKGHGRSAVARHRTRTEMPNLVDLLLLFRSESEQFVSALGTNRVSPMREEDMSG